MGIELTRDGNKLRDHGERFEAGGTYAPLELSSWAIVDFRKDMPRREAVSGNCGCLFVCFSSDFSEANLLQDGRTPEDIVIHSRGDGSSEVHGGNAPADQPRESSGCGFGSGDDGGARLPPPSRVEGGRGTGSGSGQRRGSSRSRSPQSRELCSSEARCVATCSHEEIRKRDHGWELESRRGDSERRVQRISADSRVSTHWHTGNVHWTNVALQANRELSARRT